jgi:hypothetical protein
LNGTLQLLVYADDVTLLGDNIDNVNKNTEIKEVRRNKITEQSKENKDKASSSASHSQTKESNKPPSIMITGVENQL